MFPVVTMKQDNSAKGSGFYIFYDVATFDAGGLLCLMDIKKLCHENQYRKRIYLFVGIVGNMVSLGTDIIARVGNITHSRETCFNISNGYGC